LKKSVALVIAFLIAFSMLAVLPTHALAIPAPKLPWLQVSPAWTKVGPAPSVGSIINVNVEVHNLTQDMQVVAIQFRLQYNDSVLQLVSVNEGPFMEDPTWNLYGTFFTSANNVGGDPTYPFTHVIVAELVFPNLTNGEYDQTTLPNTENSIVNSTLATFQFMVLQQNGPVQPDINTTLNVLPFFPPTDNNFIDKNANLVPDLPGVNGTVTIYSTRAFCDVNNDGTIDCKDLAMAAHAFGTTSGDGRWDARGDVNGDGKIDGKDLVLIVKSAIELATCGKAP